MDAEALTGLSCASLICNMSCEGHMRVRHNDVGLQGCTLRVMVIIRVRDTQHNNDVRLTRVRFSFCRRATCAASHLFIKHAHIRRVHLCCTRDDKEKFR
jgi:hypothetical protein